MQRIAGADAVHRRLIGAIVLMVIGLLGVAAAAIPIVFLKGSLSAYCSRIPAPDGAIVSESPAAHPVGQLRLWPVGIQCAYASTSGGGYIAVDDTWSKTVVGYGGLLSLGFGGILLRMDRKRFR